MDVSKGNSLIIQFFTSPEPLRTLSKRPKYLCALVILKLRYDALEATCAARDSVIVKSLPSLSISSLARLNALT